MFGQLKIILPYKLVTSGRHQNKAWQQLTPSSRHFLRVNAQMLYLDKQKTTQTWKTLAGITAGQTHRRMNALDERQKIIKDIIKPAFKKTGFRTSGNNFAKTEDGFIKVFSIDNISWNTKDHVSFTLRIGILFPVAQKIMDRPTPKIPSATSCHFEVVSNQLNKSNRLFDIKPDTDIEELRQYTSDVINNYVIPFFERLKTIEDCIELDTLYVSNSWDFRPFIGLTLLEKGNIKLGNKLMEKINPTYIPSFVKQLLDYQKYLLSKQKKADT